MSKPFTCEYCGRSNFANCYGLAQHQNSNRTCLFKRAQKFKGTILEGKLGGTLDVAVTAHDYLKRINVEIPSKLAAFTGDEDQKLPAS